MSDDPSWDPSPIYQPSRQPSRQPSSQPSGQPSSQPSGQPSGQPSSQPSGQPSSRPAPRQRRGRAALGAIVAPFTALLAPARALRTALAAAAASTRRAIATLGMLLLIPAAIAIVILTYWNVPTGVWAAWPIFALLAAPSLLLVLSHLIGRAIQRPTPAAYPRSAADWLIARVKLSPLLCVTVAELERGNRRSFYHPRTRTIVLADTVRDEHTARAYAIAAHELGHALIDRAMPRLAAFTLACRSVGRLASMWGALALLVIALTGHAAWLPLPFALLLLAAFAHAAVALDELGASRIAMRELRRLSAHRTARAAAPRAVAASVAAPVEAAEATEPLRAARRYLLAAFSTYGSQLVAALLPLYYWPRLRSFFGEGLLHPGAQLSARSSLLASGAAIAMLVAVAVAALMALLPSRHALCRWLIDKVLVWTSLYLVGVPLLTVLVASQPLADLALWAFIPAVLPTYILLVIPAAILFSLLAAHLPDLTLQPSPFLPRSGIGIRSLTPQAFQRGQSNRAPHRARVLLVVIFLLPLPLALLHLFG
jgi:Zn-dependent membrane protease YugP